MPLGREVEQRIELVAAEGVALGGALHLDEAAAVVHDHVHVGLGLRVLGVVEVEHRHAARQMPTETAATWPCSGLALQRAGASAGARRRRASAT